MLPRHCRVLPQAEISEFSLAGPSEAGVKFSLAARPVEKGMRDQLVLSYLKKNRCIDRISKGR